MIYDNETQEFPFEHLWMDPPRKKAGIVCTRHHEVYYGINCLACVREGAVIFEAPRQ